MRPTAAEIAASLGLEDHPEGGCFRETYRAAHTVTTARGERPASTAILFLVTASSISRLHRLASDELWVFQGGLALEVVTLAAGGQVARHVLGDPAGDEASATAGPEAAATAAEGQTGGEDVEPQVLVPAGSWQGARLAGGPHLPASRAWSLASCIVTPGFEYDDFTLGERAALMAAFPQHAELIAAFT
jgi:predicted cupin superfamily sugar epimerase